MSIFLIDDRSTHCFIYGALVKSQKVKIGKSIKRPVLLANGQKHFTKGLIKELSFNLKNQKHVGDLYVIDMGKGISFLEWIGLFLIMH